MIACIAADGYHIKSFIISERATIEAFMAASRFDQRSNEVFIPAIDRRRCQFNYTEKAIVLMAGLGAHHTDDFLENMKRRT
jgi:hypothetical protein